MEFKRASLYREQHTPEVRAGLGSLGRVPPGSHRLRQHMRLRDRQANLDPGYDDGSFRAAVYETGDISDEGVTLNNAPSLLGQVDGLKIERGSLREAGREF